MDVCAFILQSCKIPPYAIDMGEFKKKEKEKKERKLKWIICHHLSDDNHKHSHTSIDHWVISVWACFQSD